MQFNTAYIHELHSYGITEADVNEAGCYPYRLAAWRIKKHLENDKGDLWTRAANYHSKTPVYNVRYRNRLILAAKKWAMWLKERFIIHNYD